MTVYSLAALASHGLDKLSGTLLPTVPGAEAAALTALARPTARRRMDGAGRRAAARCASRARSSWSASGWPRCPARCPRRSGWPSRPGPGWPGSRAGPASAARSRPARCRTCCPAAAPVGDAEAARPRSAGPGASARCRPTRAAAPARSSPPPAAGDIDGAADRRRRPGRPARPGGGAGRASRRPASWSAWSCGSARSPTGPTWCSRSPRWRRRQGTFVNWEGRPGSFDRRAVGPVAARTDLAGAGRARRRDGRAPRPARRRRGPPRAAAALRSRRRSARPRRPARRAGGPPRGGRARRVVEHPGPGQALLATWHNLLDAGRMQDGEPNLAGTARAAVARMSAATAAEAGTADGGKVTVATGHGAITVPVEIADMPDRVVWLPTNSAGCAVRRELRRRARHPGLVEERGMTAVSSAVAASCRTSASERPDPGQLRARPVVAGPASRSSSSSRS